MSTGDTTCFYLTIGSFIGVFKSDAFSSILKEAFILNELFVSKSFLSKIVFDELLSNDSSYLLFLLLLYELTGSLDKVAGKTCLCLSD